MSPVKVERDDELFVITLTYPPVNALSISGGVVQALRSAIQAGVEEESVDVIVVRGSGDNFCAGADINDFDKDPDKLDMLRDLFAAIAGCPKTVVMALHGNVLGGGLELALSGRFRVAAPGSRLALPEVTLGLLPGAGGTQRLPRLIGVARSLEMMLLGKSIDVEEAMAVGLVDAVLADEAALDWARSHRGARYTERMSSRAASDTHAISRWRTEIACRPSLSDAREAIIDCVEAAVGLDLHQGLAVERDRFNALLNSDASRGLRHAFFSERKASRGVGSPHGTVAAKIASVAVIGAGTMGSGIALALLNSGTPVTLIEIKPKALTAGVERINAALNRDVEKGRLAAEEARRRRHLLQTSSTLDAAANADLVIEAVFEDIDIKCGVFAELDKIAKPTAMLASNTSTLDLDKIAQATSRPAHVVGLHFFSPANVMRLVEIVRGTHTAPHVLDAALSFVRDIRKVGVVAGNCDGFIGNRIFEEYLRQAYWLLEEGALPQHVDSALERWGMAMGPLRTMDLAGQDIGWSIRKRRAISQPDRPYSRIPDKLCELGRFGQKTKAGFYLYTDGRTAQMDPDIDNLVCRHSAEIGVTRRDISDHEIVERCLFVMINEGAKILAEGVAYRPLDIDVIYLNGYGFPAERGGPMFYADRIGLGHVLERMRAFASGREGWAWQAAPLLEDLARRGVSLATLNR